MVAKSTFVCQKHMISLILSLLEGGVEFHSEYVDTYRQYQGILNNSSTDNRTTARSFHIVEGWPKLQIDMIDVPKLAFVNMLKLVFNSLDVMHILPFSSEQQTKALLSVSAHWTAQCIFESSGSHSCQRMML